MKTMRSLFLILWVTVILFGDRPVQALAPVHNPGKMDLPMHSQTSFFRDYSSLYRLFDTALEKILKIKSEEKLSPGYTSSMLIHSAGASDLSEAYSIAIFIQEHHERHPELWGGLKLENVRIVATENDWSAYSLGLQGLYPDLQLVDGFGNKLALENPLAGRVSRRQRKEELLKYFDPVDNLYRIKEKYKSLVDSRLGDLTRSKDHPKNADLVLLNNVWDSNLIRAYGAQFLPQYFENIFNNVIQSLKPGTGYLITNMAIRMSPLVRVVEHAEFYTLCVENSSQDLKRGSDIFDTAA